ncbi:MULTISPECIES: Ig-like domain-containing protein [unclassified Pseudoalteromonas]|uniref:Ig-like domain-containing protein n=2 Tax=Pseudoalteromonas TaxID=53246 RepID=UPI0002315EAD|nr:MULTISPECIES: Ig-like domain-containing protein [unclassified Pseudoalteromonas]ATG76610.1 hypothetical protein AOR04_03100 [Pseudoalteromonas sp. 1_2015MBL_MicDiv]GAA78911.1 hypothetical protein P20495_1406 [Pseudoalteromonas sp. BSi20495]
MNKLIQLTPILCTLILTGCGGGSSNKAPLFNEPNLSFTLNEDTSFTAQVTATDDDVLSYTLANAPSNGIIAVEANGEFTYTPFSNYFGEDTATISANDGSLTANVVIRFAIENVNDAPQLLATNVFVTSSTTTEGVITTQDLDGDTVTISLITPPSNGVMSINSTTGEFTYKAQTLSSIDEQFEISYTDGLISEPLTAIISLSPSYVTNEDKLNYYYSSSLSHLKQADELSVNIADELSRYDVYATQAAAYARAGFLDTASDYLALINEQTARSSALKEVAQALDEIGQTEKANDYRDQAVAAYNQYLADKGFDNIASSDASALYSLVKSYLAADQVSQASNLLNTISLYAEQVREEEYTSSYGFFLNGVRLSIDDALESYAQSLDESDLTQAKLLANNYAQLAVKAGYRLVRSGEYKGQPYEQYKTLHGAWAAQYLYRAGEFEAAKDYTNQVLAMYGSTGFDSNYNYSTSAYSAATLDNYTYPIQFLAGLIEGLYQSDENPAIMLSDSETDINNAQEQVYGFNIANRLLAGEDINSAAAQARSFFTENGDYSEFFRALTSLDNVPGTGLILSEAGRNDLAQQVFTYAGDFLVSDEYISKELSTTVLTGYKGCKSLVDLTARVGGDAASAANKCLTMLNTLNAGDVRTLSNSSSITAHNQVMVSLIKGGLSEQVAGVHNQLLSYIALGDTEDRFEARLETLGYLVNANQTSLASTTLNDAIAEITPALNELTSDQLETILAAVKAEVIGLEAATGGEFERYSMLSSMGTNAANISDFSANYSNAKNQASTLLNTLEPLILGFANTIIADNMEDLVNSFTLINDITKAQSLITNGVNGEADQLELYIGMTNLVASRDDFRGIAIASVDTDHDGLPNFFLPNSSDEDIALAGLIADQDADNDGVIDSEDTTPLGI